MGRPFRVHEGGKVHDRDIFTAGLYRFFQSKISINSILGQKGIVFYFLSLSKFYNPYVRAMAYNKFVMYRFSLGLIVFLYRCIAIPSFKI